MNLTIMNNEPEEIEIKGDLHPSIERSLFRLAVDNALTKDQRNVWVMWNFDRLTEDQIAEKLNISQQSVSKRIAVIESKIKKWVGLNKGTYLLMKLEQKIINEVSANDA